MIPDKNVALAIVSRCNSNINSLISRVQRERCPSLRYYLEYQIHAERLYKMDIEDRFMLINNGGSV